MVWKLMIGTGLPVIAGVLFCGWLAGGVLESTVTQQAVTRLAGDAALIGPEGAEGLAVEPEQTQRVVRQLGERLDCRLVVIPWEGGLAFDSWREAPSEEEPTSLEVVSVRLGGQPYASDVRYRLSSDEPVLYLAAPVRREGVPVGVIRLSRSVSDYVVARGRVRWAVLLGLFGGLAISWGGAWLMARRLRGRLERARDRVLSPFAPTGPETPAVFSRSIFARLEDAVQLMRAQIAERIDSVEQNRRDLQTMLETIPEAVLAIDSSQRILFANPNTFRLFDLPPHDIAGHRLWEILRQPGLQDAVQRTLAHPGETTVEEFQVRRPPRTLVLRGRRLPAASRSGVILVLQDVTAIRRLERLRQDFFANVSHELKTPLASIKAYAETLLDDDLQQVEMVRRFLGRIDEQTDRLHALVLDMLMLARVESEEHAFDVGPIELAGLLKELVASSGTGAGAASVELVDEVPDEVGVVLADAEALQMIFRNLVDNAIKYTPAGGRVVVVASRGADAVEVRVTDTGVGIPAADLERVFERFYRVDKARSRELGGTGLGLSIVKHLTQRFSGSVSVASRLNEGSTFTVRLPLTGRRAVARPSVRSADEGP